MAQVSALTLSEEDLHPSTSEILAAEQADVIRGSGEGLLESEQEITRAGNPGRSFRFFVSLEEEGTYYARCDIYLVINRSYRLLVMSTEEAELESPEVLHFFESFQVGGRRER
jgi:hypothetical protein